ncbi:MAG: carboxypeptidase-like regulatory domain-containing protein [Acidobacteriota bacterium]
MNAKLVLGFVLTVLCFSSVAVAQNYRSSLRGRIADPQGAAVAGAKLNLISQETNETRSATSDARGEYVFLLIRPGSYRLEVEQTGFGKFEKAFELSVNQDLRLDVGLRVGTVQVDDNLIVSSVAPLKYENASLGAVIDNRQVTGLRWMVAASWN